MTKQRITNKAKAINKIIDSATKEAASLIEPMSSSRLVSAAYQCQIIVAINECRAATDNRLRIASNE